MKQYLDLLRHILVNGRTKSDRTGTGTRSVFGYQMRFDLNEGFPLVTTKKLYLRAIVHELLWFLKGSTNNNDLKAVGVSIWDEWAGEDGELGPIYGKQWRAWAGSDGRVYDQIKLAIDQLKNNPDSRRNIVSAWNVADLEHMALMPCHTLFQFYADKLTRLERIAYCQKVHGHNQHFEKLEQFYREFDENLHTCDDGVETAKRADEANALADSILTARGVPTHRLSCQLYQRSADSFLGVPYNIASYALLTHMVAQVTNMAVGDFIHTFGDLHIYSNHMEQVNLQLSRESKPLPTLLLNPAIKDIDDFTFDDIKFVGYDSHPAIKAPVAV